MKIIVCANGTGDFKTISEALQQANSDSIIMVKPGIYNESILIDKDRSIIGDGPVEEIIIEQSLSSCITVKAGNATIKGISIRDKKNLRKAMKKHKTDALLVMDGSLQLENCHISSLFGNGIKAVEHATLTLNQCTIRTSLYAGLTLSNHSNAILRNCTIGLSYEGFVISGNSKVEMDNTTINSLNVGIKLTEQADINIRNSHITSDKIGIFSDGGKLVLTDCTIDKAKAGVSAYGGNITINHCDIINFKDTGIFIKLKGNVTIRNTKISGGKKGIFHCGDTLTIENSHINGTKLAVSIVEAINSNLINAHFYDCRYGIYVLNAEVTAKGCHVYGNKTGVSVNGKSNITLLDTRIEDCLERIYLEKGSQIEGNFTRDSDSSSENYTNGAAHEKTSSLTLDNETSLEPLVSQNDMKQIKVTSLSNYIVELSNLYQSLKEYSIVAENIKLPQFNQRWNTLNKELEKYIHYLNDKIDESKKISILKVAHYAGIYGVIELKLNQLKEQINFIDIEESYKINLLLNGIAQTMTEIKKLV